MNIQEHDLERNRHQEARRQAEQRRRRRIRIIGIVLAVVVVAIAAWVLAGWDTVDVADGGALHRFDVADVHTLTFDT